MDVDRYLRPHLLGKALVEGYLIGMYEDKDLVTRITGGGKKLVKVGHVKHVGNATWGKLPNTKEIFLRNKERYERRWETEA